MGLIFLVLHHLFVIWIQCEAAGETNELLEDNKTGGHIRIWIFQRKVEEQIKRDRLSPIGNNLADHAAAQVVVIAEQMVTVLKEELSSEQRENKEMVQMAISSLEQYYCVLEFIAKAPTEPNKGQAGQGISGLSPGLQPCKVVESEILSKKFLVRMYIIHGVMLSYWMIQDPAVFCALPFVWASKKLTLHSCSNVLK